MYISVCIYIYTHTRIYIFTCMYVHMYVCVSELLRKLQSGIDSKDAFSLRLLHCGVVSHGVA